VAVALVVPVRAILASATAKVLLNLPVWVSALS
jgi:hypothetical protein